MLAVWDIIDRNSEFFEYHTKLNNSTIHYQDFTQYDDHYFYAEQKNGNMFGNRQIRPSRSNPDFYEKDNAVSDLKIGRNHMSFVYERDGFNTLDIRGISYIDKDTHELIGIKIDGELYSSKQLSKFSKKLSAEYTRRTGKNIDTVRLSSTYTGRAVNNIEESFASAFARHANVNTIGFDSDVIAVHPHFHRLSMGNSSTINTQLTELGSPSIKSVGMYSGEVRYSHKGNWAEANRGVQFSPSGRRAALKNINDLVDFF